MADGPYIPIHQNKPDGQAYHAIDERREAWLAVWQNRPDGQLWRWNRTASANIPIYRNKPDRQLYSFRRK